MGNQIQSEDIDRFYHRFSVIHRDPVKNLLYMEEKRTGKEFVLRQLSTNDEIQKTRVEMLVNEKRRVRNKFLLRLEDHFYERDKGYCSNQFKAYLLFESHYKDLREEMLDRRINHSYFEDDELLSIIESGCMALKYLKEINQPHQAVCSDNILINRDGIIMLSDPWLNSQSMSNLPNVHIYPSPEKLECMNNIRSDYNWYTSDLFSLGMVILEAVNLEFLDDIYKPNYRDINYLSLENKLQAIKNSVIKNYVEKLLRSEKHRLEVVQEIDYQVKRNIKPVIESIKMIQSIEKPVEINQAVTTTTYVTEPTYEVQATHLSTEAFRQNVFSQNQIVPQIQLQPQSQPQFSPVFQPTPQPQPQPQHHAFFYKNLAITPSNTHFSEAFLVKDHHTQSNLTPISHFPLKNKQKGETKLRNSRGQNGKSGLAYTHISGNQNSQPPQVSIPLNVSPQLSRAGMFNRNFEVRSRLIEADQSASNKEIRFNYSSNPHQSSAQNIQIQRAESPAHTIMNIKPTLPNPPAPNFTKPPAFIVSGSTGKTQVNHSDSAKNISIKYVNGNSPSTSLNIPSLGATATSHIYTTNAAPPINQNSITVGSSSYESHSFIKKVPPPIGASISTPSVNKSSDKVSILPIQSNPSATSTFKQIQNSVRFNENPILAQTTSTSATFSSGAAKRLQELLKNPMSAADAELFTKPEILGKDFTKIFNIPKQYNSNLVIQTSTEPEVFNFKYEKPQQYQHVQKYEQAENVGQQNKASKVQQTEPSSYEKTSYYPVQYKTPHGLYIHTDQPLGDFYTYDMVKLELQKVSEPPYYSNYTSSYPIASSEATTAPIVPSLSLPTAVTTPTIQSERTYKIDYELNSKGNQQYQAINKAVKTDRPEVKNTHFEQIQYKPVQKDKEFLKTTVVSDFEVKQQTAQEYTANYLNPSIPDGQPIYNHPNPTLYDGRIGQPQQVSNEQKHTGSEGQADNSRQAKSSNAQDSMHNNSSKSLINGINMTEPPVPSVYLQQNHIEVAKPNSPRLDLIEVPNEPPPVTNQQPEIIEAQKQTQQTQNEGTPSRPQGAQNQKYNSTIPEVTESENSGAQDDESQYVIEEYEVGSRYEGYKRKGMRNGKGKFFYQDGGYYEGEWKDNKMHGQGKLYYNQSKLAYEGEWYMDQFHGHGKVYNDNPIMLETPFNYKDFDQLDEYWVYYEGNLVTDTKQGLGKLKLSNGQIFQGEFKYDRIEGKGKFITISGDIINGIWKDSKLVKVL